MIHECVIPRSRAVVPPLHVLRLLLSFIELCALVVLCVDCFFSVTRGIWCLLALAILKIVDVRASRLWIPICPQDLFFVFSLARDPVCSRSSAQPTTKSTTRSKKSQGRSLCAETHLLGLGLIVGVVPLLRLLGCGGDDPSGRAELLGRGFRLRRHDCFRSSLRRLLVVSGNRETKKKLKVVVRVRRKRGLRYVEMEMCGCGFTRKPSLD